MNNKGYFGAIAVLLTVGFFVSVGLIVAWSNIEADSYYIDGAVVSLDHNTSYYSKSTTIILDNGKVLIRYDYLLTDIVVGTKYRFHMGINNSGDHYIKSYMPINE